MGNKALIIIPAYNEAQNIEKVITDIKKNTKNFDYIIINDCSTDKTKEICETNRYNLINLPVNLGIGGCVQTGYLYAKKSGYKYAVQFDGDGQHSAKYLEKMLEELKVNKYDMLIGSRFITNEGFQSSGMRRLGIRLLSNLIKFFNKIEIRDVTSGYRLVNNKIIEEFCNYYPKDYPEPESLNYCLRKNYKVNEIPVLMNRRENGVSSINHIKAGYYMLKVSLAIILDNFKR